MAKAEKQQDGTWAIRAWWRDAAGKNCSKHKSGFHRARDAEKWAREYADQQKNTGIEDSYKLKLIDFLDSWVKIKDKSLSPNTLAGYRVNIEKVRESALGGMVLQDVRLLHVQNFISSLSGRPNTIKYVYRTLHAAMEYAVKSRIVQYNPSDGVELPDGEQFEATYLSIPDAQELLESLRAQNHELYVPVMFAMMYGMRRGEALGIRWQDIDFETRAMTISKNYTTNGKNGTVYRKVKTKGSNRTVILSPKFADELIQIRNARSACGFKISVFVVESIMGEMPDPRSMVGRLNRFQRANGLKECRFHDLRHTFAALQRASGTDLDTLKRMLGHAKIGTTSDMYLNADDNLMKAATSKIERLVFGKKKRSQKSQNSAS